MKSSMIVSIFFGMLILAPFGNLVVASGSTPSKEDVAQKEVMKIKTTNRREIKI